MLVISPFSQSRKAGSATVRRSSRDRFRSGSCSEGCNRSNFTEWSPMRLNATQSNRDHARKRLAPDLRAKAVNISLNICVHRCVNGAIWLDCPHKETGSGTTRRFGCGTKGREVSALVAAENRRQLAFCKLAVEFEADAFLFRPGDPGGCP